MNLRYPLLAFTHLGALGLGFALGIYALPLLTAPSGPDEQAIAAATATASYTAEFRRDLKGSDLLHWGEGRVLLGPQQVVLEGRLAPGPDYQLYLSPVFVETEADFLREQPRMLKVGPVRSFENFLVALPTGVDLANYTAVVVWCEAFGQFITAAAYRE